MPHWANWEHFNELDKKGLMMYGQMTAGSWIKHRYPGIVQGTYETFFAVANQHFDGKPAGRWILTGAWVAWVAPSRWPLLWPVSP